MTLINFTKGIPEQSPQGKVTTWVTFANSSIVLGTIPANFFVDRINLHVHTAFNAGTTNQISVGYTGTQEAFGTLTAVGTTGRKTVTMGSLTGLNTTGRDITVYFTQTGSTATTGKAYVEVFLYRIPPTP